DAEWKQLEKSLGMTDAQANSINFRGTHNEGNKLKEAGTVHWNSPNTGATNETGFTALPGGYRAESNIFSILGETGNWWSSTFYNSDNAYYRSMSYVQSGVYRSDEGKNEYGLSVRCVRN
ncbi:MAG: FISUMP domain-containing protein, partial [Bacteroidales bacterium]|nr:FISUMP domain-containing protein [Bacteroidales bacterium]